MKRIKERCFSLSDKIRKAISSASVANWHLEQIYEVIITYHYNVIQMQQSKSKCEKLKYGVWKKILLRLGIIFEDVKQKHAKYFSTSSTFRIKPSGLFSLELNWNCGFYRHLVGFLGRVIGPVVTSLHTQDNTITEAKQTDFRTSSETRNHDPSVWVGEDISRLRLRGHCDRHAKYLKTKKLNSVALVRKRTIPTERPPLVDEMSATFCG
jgi:hypothetical protein